MNRPKILIISDTPNWAISRNVDAIVKRLSHKYEFEKARLFRECGGNPRGYKFIMNVDVTRFDLVILRTILHIGELKYAHILRTNRNRLVATIASHHGWGNERKQFAGRIGDFGHIFCVSDNIYAGAREHIRGWKNKIYYTPQGIDTEIFKKYDRERGNKLVVGWAGNAAHGFGNDHKRFYGVIAPLARLLHEKYNFRIAVKNIKEKTKNMLVKNRIPILDIPFDEMPEFYNSVDVFLNASKSEAIASTTVESVGCGTPVITTPVGHARNLIVNEKTGFVIEQNTNENLIKNFCGRLSTIEKMDIGKMRDVNRFIAKNILSWDILISHTDMAIAEALKSNV